MKVFYKPSNRTKISYYREYKEVIVEIESP